MSKDHRCVMLGHDAAFKLIMQQLVVLKYSETVLKVLVLWEALQKRHLLPLTLQMTTISVDYVHIVSYGNFLVLIFDGSTTCVTNCCMYKDTYNAFILKF